MYKIILYMCIVYQQRRSVNWWRPVRISLLLAEYYVQHCSMYASVRCHCCPLRTPRPCSSKHLRPLRNYILYRVCNFLRLKNVLIVIFISVYYFPLHKNGMVRKRYEQGSRAACFCVHCVVYTHNEHKRKKTNLTLDVTFDRTDSNDQSG